MIASMTAVVSWGFGPLSVRAISASAPTIALYRFAAAVPLFLVVARVTGGRLDRRLMRGALAPGLCFGLSFVTSFESFQRTSIANATLIGSLSPLVILPVAALMMGDRLGARRLGFGLMAVIGVAMTVLGASSSSDASFTGDLLAAGTLLLFSAQLILVKRHRDLGAHAWAFVAAISTVGVAVIVPWALLVGVDHAAFGGTDWVLLALMILGPGLLGHGLMTWAQAHVDASVTALLMLGSPVIASLGAWVFFDQALSGWQMSGAVVVLGALAGVVLDNRRRA